MGRRRKEDDDGMPVDESAWDELIDNPVLPPMTADGPVETSYDKALNVITATEGELLELTTRTNPISARALAIGYSMIATFRSRYSAGRYDQLMRLLVSMGGKGRQEIVDTLRANSGAFEVPGASNDGPMFMPASEE